MWRECIPGHAWRIFATVEAADEIREQLPPAGAILVGSLQHPKWLAFDCPCKTGHRMVVTLDRAHYPHWTLLDAKKLSISPSVAYRSSRRTCHYLFRRRKVLWVKERMDHRQCGK